MYLIFDPCSIGNDRLSLFRATIRTAVGLNGDAMPANSADGDVHA
jgi:hypothetical protein